MEAQLPLRRVLRPLGIVETLQGGVDGQRAQLEELPDACAHWDSPLIAGLAVQLAVMMGELVMYQPRARL